MPASSGLVAGIGNSSSILEQSRKLIYPREESVRSKIPLWMKFYCYEYSSSAIGRVAAYSTSAGGAHVPLLTAEKAQIMVPAPANFTTNTAHNYVAQPSAITNIFPSGFNTLAEAASNIATSLGLGGGVNAINELSKKIQEMTNTVLSTGDYLAGAAGFGSLLTNADSTDSEFIPSGPSRQFEIRMTLPCLTPEDSKAAGLIVRAFDALSLPTARAVFSLTTAKYFHPPLWVFGVGPANSLKFDPDWSGMPQISVLKSVSHKQTAYETNSLAALGYPGILKPVSYTITLMFQELEPAFRRTSAPTGETGLEITNRSGILASSPIKIPGVGP